MGWVISWANEWEDYSDCFGEEVEISRNWAATSSLVLLVGFGALMEPVGVLFSVPVCCYKCACVCSVAQSSPTLCDPMDCSLAGSFVHGIFQTRMCILKLRSSGSWICPLSWIRLVLISLCPWAVCHSCEVCALPPSLLFSFDLHHSISPSSSPWQPPLDFLFL